MLLNMKTGTEYYVATMVGHSLPTPKALLSTQGCVYTPGVVMAVGELNRGKRLHSALI